MTRSPIAAILFISLALLSASVRADQVILDPYTGAFSNQEGGSDVVGLHKLFDIDRIRFLNLSQNNVTVELLFNYNRGNASLAPFNFPTGTCDETRSNCVELWVGDLLFDAGADSTYYWGVPLYGHDGLQAGNLYQMQPNGYTTSDQEMAGKEAYFTWAYDRPVRIDADKLDAQGRMGAGVATYGMAVPGSYEVKTTLSFSTGNTDMWEQFLDNGELSVHFASAICANDYIDGMIYAPEPDSYLLFGGGLLLLIGVGRRLARC
jgi:hypothetical protein